MEFKKCNRCGNFYLSEGHICPKCIAKENREFQVFQNYCEENGIDASIDSISSATGISEENLTRFINYEENYTDSICDSNFKTIL